MIEPHRLASVLEPEVEDRLAVALIDAGLQKAGELLQVLVAPVVRPQQELFQLDGLGGVRQAQLVENLQLRMVLRLGVVGFGRGPRGVPAVAGRNQGGTMRLLLLSVFSELAQRLCKRHYIGQ